MFKAPQVLYFLNASSSGLDSLEGVYFLQTALLDELRYLEDRVAKREKKQFLVLFGEDVFDLMFLVYGSEQLVVGLDPCLAYQGAAGGTGYGLIVAEEKHVADAVVAEGVVVETSLHGPFAEHVIGIEADIADDALGALALG